MADGWEYAVVNLSANDDGVYSGWLIFDGQEPQPLQVPRIRERLTVLSSGNGPTRSYVYGWDYLLKRRL
jgi:hypothetical protein